MVVHADEDVRRAQILDAAKRCFASCGYHETRVDDIAREAGLSKGALYWYFDSKQEILGLLCEDYSKDLEGVFLEAANAHDLDPVHFLIEIGAQMLQHACGDEARRLVWLEHWSHAARDPESRDQLTAIHQHWLDITIPLVEKSITEGKLKKVDPRHFMVGLMAMFDGILAMRAFHSDVDPVDLWRSLAEMLLDGIRADGGEASDAA